MRDVPAIWETWRSGVYVGDQKPATRVTVEVGWRLRATGAVLGTWNKGPARWFQDALNSQYETEVPNVISFTSNRTIDSDAGTCEIVIKNNVTPDLAQPHRKTIEWGEPGYFTWDHGVTPDTRARWGHMTNPWKEVLVPNALIRTYQGFGGHDKPLFNAKLDGNVVLNGVWLVDDVRIETEGTVTLTCRDMGKLLVDQQIFPPLVPTDKYPLDYRRWIYKVVDIPGDPAPAGEYCFPCEYAGSSTDEVYGEFNTGATGHPGSHAFDISYEAGDPNSITTYSHQRTYWLSEPKDSPADSVWIEFTVNGGNPGIINNIYFHAWKGWLEGPSVMSVMVSVFENGQWVAPETSLGGWTPQGLPYVSTFQPGEEHTPGQITQGHPLPRDFNATRIRLTVTSLLNNDSYSYGYRDADNPIGFRGGARKIMACFHPKAPNDTRLPLLTHAAANVPHNDDNRQGYWQVRANGQVFAFGDARVYEATSPANTPLSTVLGMAAHPSGTGYWYVDAAGRVISAGSAQYYGDLSGTVRSDVVDIAPAPDGDGYWLLTLGGEVHQFGSAADHGDSPPSGTMPNGAPVLARSIDSHPSTNGYWVLHTDGTVTAHNVPHYGDATDRTGFTESEYVGSIHRTSTGLGYWVLSGSGKIQAKGDAPHKGNADLRGYDGDKWYRGICWDFIPSPVDDQGYAIQTADGNLWIKGNAKGLSYGSVGSGKATQRFDGNYKDYADIIKDLVLWAGFYLYRNPQPAAEFPGIFGNIETTGAWAEDPLPKDMFDKKPIIDPIKQIRQIVGYVTFIDAEGGFRFESPNWWSIGNYLIDGTPYMSIPEIDERQQLLQHGVTRSAKDARSRLIISTADPYPATPGQEAPKNVVTTEIVPSTADDLKGLVVPAMWVNGQFLRKDEQQVMAELIDMRIWFGRRMASLACVANPLIDLNDQVRIIERQSGEVYIHYVRGIQIKHDLQGGDFQMTLTTHWLGGVAMSDSPFHLAAAMMPNGHGYWQVRLSGQVSAFGDAELYDSHQADSHVGWVVGLRSTPSGHGYYTLDGNGKVLTYGDAEHQGNATPVDLRVIPASHPITDFALTPSGSGYWILSQDGQVFTFGDAVFYGEPSAGGRTLPSGKPVHASSIESHPTTQGYWILWSDGVVDAFNLPNYGGQERDSSFTASEITTTLRRNAAGDGYWISSGGGDRVTARGNATVIGSADQYPDSNWAYGLVWDILVSPTGGYALARADGTLVPFNGFEVLGEPVDVAPVEAFWAIGPPEMAAARDKPDYVFVVSQQVVDFLAGTESPSANNAVTNKFAAPNESAVLGR